MKKLIIFATVSLLSGTVLAHGKAINCTAEYEKSGFRIEAYLGYDHKSSRFMLSHFRSFALWEKLKGVTECRDPWYEKFLTTIKSDGPEYRSNYHLELSENKILSSHEYTKGCFVHFELPRNGGTGKMWTTSNGSTSNVVTTVCKPSYWQ